MVDPLSIILIDGIITQHPHIFLVIDTLLLLLHRFLLLLGIERCLSLEIGSLGIITIAVKLEGILSGESVGGLGSVLLHILLGRKVAAHRGTLGLNTTLKKTCVV